MKCAACGYDDRGQTGRHVVKEFIKVLGLVKTEKVDLITNETFYQTNNLVGCPECKTLRLSYE